MSIIRNLDGVAALGGDAVILNPLCANAIPNGVSDSFWDLFPDDTYAAEIRNYTEKLGLRTGIYMGTAETGARGNSSMISYAGVGKCYQYSPDTDYFVGWFVMPKQGNDD